MIPEMPLLSFGIFIALMTGIAIWIFHLTSRKSNVQRVEKLETGKICQQPWDTDKSHRSGNR